MTQARLIRLSGCYDRRAIMALAHAALAASRRRGEAFDWGGCLAWAWRAARKQRAAHDAGRPAEIARLADLLAHHIAFRPAPTARWSPDHATARAA
jgi:hypothetical protein